MRVPAQLSAGDVDEPSGAPTEPVELLFESFFESFQDFDLFIMTAVVVAVFYLVWFLMRVFIVAATKPAGIQV